MGSVIPVTATAVPFYYNWFRSPYAHPRRYSVLPSQLLLAPRERKEDRCLDTKSKQGAMATKMRSVWLRLHNSPSDDPELAQFANWHTA